MPAKVQVKVVAARDLPIMDRSSELTDAFVELRLGHDFEKTEVCAKSLNPVWDSKWFSFKIDEEDLQEEPLQVRLMDHDTYSAHNAIGKVYIPLNSLTDAAGTQNSGTLDGWFPIYDTLHGIRGEVQLVVKVEILKDQHRFRQSSCGIMFFTCPQTPSCYTTRAVHGFVEELVVNDDPEYKWIDRIRTPRASNEARQRLFAKLTGELQRKIGLKTIEVGGNAVIGYQQYFDLEGDTGIVVRGIGTCVSLIPDLHSTTPSNLPVLLPASVQGQVSKIIQEELLEQTTVVMSPKQRLLNRKTSSSDSDGPSSPNRGSGHYVDGGASGGIHPGTSSTNPVIKPSSDFPFYTLTLLPPGLLRHVGGIVSSRSVKLLDKIKDPDEPETRDMWWLEVRNEVRSHALAMGCNAVIGYSESTSICDTLCILSAFGTAVYVKSPAQQPIRRQISPGSSVDDRDMEAKESGMLNLYPHCGVCHVPYSPPHKLPFEGQLANCSICSSHLVPSLLLSTAEPPAGVAVRGHGTLVQVRVVQSKRRMKGDDNAIYISKQLPFLEHKLYTRLLNKVRIRGMNAVFCLQVQYMVGDTIIIGVATGTSVYLEALPPPSKLGIADRDKSSDPKQLVSILDAFNKTQSENMAKYGLEQPMDLPRVTAADHSVITEDGDQSAISELSLSMGRPEAFVFDVDDHLIKEDDIAEIMLELQLPKGFYIVNTQTVPGLDMPSSLSSEYRIITMVSKKSLEPGKQQLEKQCVQLFNEMHQALAFKVRRASPCQLTRIHYDMDLPEDDMLQVAITCMVTKMQQTSSMPTSHSDEMIFAMEEHASGVASSLQQEHEKTREKNKAGAVRITPLPAVCGQLVERYLRIVNFFVIRESTSIRENGGLDSFMHLFTLEALAIARAHVAAIGGNTLLNFRLNDCVLIEHPHKNQAQCLLNVSGDAAVLIPCPPAATAATGGDITGTSQSMSTEMLPPGNQRDEAKQEAGVAGSDGGKLTVPLIAASGSAKAASSQKRKAKAVFAHRGIEKLGELSRN